MFQPWPLQVIFDYVILSKPIPVQLREVTGIYWDFIVNHLHCHSCDRHLGFLPIGQAGGGTP